MDKPLQQSFARLEHKQQTERLLLLLKYVNTVFIVLSLISLLIEFASFSFLHWYLDLCIFYHLSFVTVNLCLTLLNPESQRFWLMHRWYCAYVPFGIMLLLTIIEVSVFGSIIEEKIE